VGAPQMEDATAGGEGAVLTADVGPWTSGFGRPASGPSISARTPAMGWNVALDFGSKIKLGARCGEPWIGRF
jgi:hypothetical protein